MSNQRFTAETYDEIRHCWESRADGETQADLADEFGTSQSHVSRVVREVLPTEEQRPLEVEEVEAEWRKRAACHGVDTDLFFSCAAEATLDAKAICGGCPVREECLDYALTTRQVDGVWGGADERERRRPGRRPKRKTGPTPQGRRLEVEQVRSLRKRGLPDVEIARLLGTHRDAVRRAAGPRSA